MRQIAVKILPLCFTCLVSCTALPPVPLGSGEASVHPNILFGKWCSVRLRNETSGSSASFYFSWLGGGDMITHLDSGEQNRLKYSYSLYAGDRFILEKTITYKEFCIREKEEECVYDKDFNEYCWDTYERSCETDFTKGTFRLEPQERRLIVEAFSGAQPASTLSLGRSTLSLGRLNFGYPTEVNDFMRAPTAFCTDYRRRAEAIRGE